MKTAYEVEGTNRVFVTREYAERACPGAKVKEIEIAEERYNEVVNRPRYSGADTDCTER